MSKAFGGLNARRKEMFSPVKTQSLKDIRVVLMVVFVLFPFRTLAQEAQKLLQETARNHQDLCTYHIESAEESTYESALKRSWEKDKSYIGSSRSEPLPLRAAT